LARSKEAKKRLFLNEYQASQLEYVEGNLCGWGQRTARQAQQNGMGLERWKKELV
jgi:hypothetical protein